MDPDLVRQQREEERASLGLTPKKPLAPAIAQHAEEDRPAAAFEPCLAIPLQALELATEFVQEPLLAPAPVSEIAPPPVIEIAPPTPPFLTQLPRRRPALGFLNFVLSSLTGAIAGGAAGFGISVLAQLGPRDASTVTLTLVALGAYSLGQVPLRR